MEQTVNEVAEIISSYAAIIIPLITYIVTGVVAFIKLIGAFKDLSKDVRSKVDETKTEMKSKQSEVDELRGQLKLMAKENAETRREMKRLTFALNKVVPNDEQGDKEI